MMSQQQLNILLDEYEKANPADKVICFAGLNLFGLNLSNRNLSGADLSGAYLNLGEANE